eukprot:TRINITY_DN74292_c0_g1_i1.p2 TRINITY_DN74292_c0_g1~~TRINITY_DN74292_c0_g1_i1.p2  ORF type:complete len:176 (-),score=37.34 TRINITY_DN74292_c0_g1_i1:9-482(-)
MDAAADAAFESDARSLGLHGAIFVEGSPKLPSVPRLAGSLRRALHRSLEAALGPAAQASLRVRIRPGGGGLAFASQCAMAAETFSFAVLPGDAQAAGALLEHLRLEAAHGGRVCLLPELASLLEEEGHQCSCSLMLQVAAGPQLPESSELCPERAPS